MNDLNSDLAAADDRILSVIANFIIGGAFVLYLFAGTVAYWIVRQPYGNDSYQVTHDSLHQTTWVVRGLAVLLIGSGYAERIIAALRLR